MTNKQCIPVWHENRSVKDFRRDCEEYDYVAVGGFAAVKSAKEMKKYQKRLQTFNYFIDIAHQNNCKIHGLGFTSTAKFDDIKFDSVDSTTWTIGGRMENVCYFDGKNIKQKHYNGKRVKDANKLNEFNFLQWCKFQRYAENL